MNLKTLVVGASPNPARYSYMATNRLLHQGHEVILTGIKKGEIAGLPILNIREKPLLYSIHTITLYINPWNQEEYIDYFISLEPQRIIFNPGTENHDFAKRASDAGIDVEVACTLVLLSAGTY